MMCKLFVLILSLVFSSILFFSSTYAAEFEQKSEQREQICVKNSLKGHLPYMCFLHIQEGYFVSFAEKSEMEYYLKKLKLNWTFQVVSRNNYREMLKMAPVDTYTYRWSEQIGKLGLMQCLSGVFLKFLEGGIPVSTAAAVPSFAFGELVGGVAGFALTLPGGISVATAPVVITMASGAGGVLFGGIAGIGGFIGGGTAMITSVLSNKEEKDKICGSIYLYSLLPENTTNRVLINDVTNLY